MDNLFDLQVFFNRGGVYKFHARNGTMYLAKQNKGADYAILTNMPDAPEYVHASIEECVLNILTLSGTFFEGVKDEERRSVQIS